jgi:RNA polymerase sigma-70 factor (ECF subfamily)
MVTLTKEKAKLTLFEREFLPLADSLFNFVVSLTKNRADAEDVVQETYLKAYRSLATFKEGTNAKAWLFTIARNTFINRYRKNQNSPTEIELIEEAAYKYREDATADTDQYPDLRDADVFTYVLSDEVLIALEALKEEFRTAVILRDVEHMSYEDIAEITNTRLNTVRTRIRRGRQQLAERLLEYAAQFGYENKRFGDEND